MARRICDHSDRLAELRRKRLERQLVKDLQIVFLSAGAIANVDDAKGVCEANIRYSRWYRNDLPKR